MANEAARQFEPALDFESRKHANDQTMVMGALIDRLMDAYLLSGDYPRAAEFASAWIEKNAANQEVLGPKLRNEVDRLKQGGRKDDALKLIDAINKMRTPLATRDLDFIRGIDQNLRGPRSASGSELRDAVGSGQ